MSVVKVLAVLGSPNTDGTSNKMLTNYCDGITKAAAEKGITVEVKKVVLAQKQYSPCKYCTACHKTGKCALKDDINDILEDLVNSDIVVHAVPIWYFGMPGYVKVYVDRWTALYKPGWAGFRDEIAGKMKGKVFATLAVCGAPNAQEMCASSIAIFKETIDITPEVKWAGSVSTSASGMDALGKCEKLGKDSLAMFLEK